MPKNEDPGTGAALPITAKDLPRLVAPTAKTVTNKALTSNVATLTIGAHDIEQGDQVTVAGVDATFNGDFTVSAVGGTTVSYPKTAANVGSVASGGTVLEVSGPGDSARSLAARNLRAANSRVLTGGEVTGLPAG